MIGLISSAAMIFGLGAAADAFFKPATKKKYSDLLFSYRHRFMAEVAQFVVSLFELVFDGRRRRVALWRSVVLSTVLFCVFSFLTARILGEDLAALILSGTHENRGALIIVLFMNCAADYLSLCQTKFLMTRLVGSSILSQVAGLVLDVTLTFLVISGFIAAAFWVLASSLGVPGWSWSSPGLMLWQMCHQLDSTVITLSSSSTNISKVCELFQSTPASSPSSSRSFEYAFNTASLMTSYTVTAWIVLFLLVQIVMRGLQLGFTKYSKAIGKLADYRTVPFSITALFFALIYLVAAAPTLAF